MFLSGRRFVTGLSSTVELCANTHEIINLLRVLHTVTARTHLLKGAIQFHEKGRAVPKGERMYRYSDTQALLEFERVIEDINRGLIGCYGCVYTDAVLYIQLAESR
jgi:hypothetical protein